jgi:hypothetical protein
MHRSALIFNGIFYIIKQKTYQCNHQGNDSDPNPDSKKILHFDINNKVFLCVKLKDKK